MMHEQEPPMTMQDEQPPPPESPSSTHGETANSDAVEEIAAPSFLPDSIPDSPDGAIADAQAALMSEGDFREFLASLFPATAYSIGLVYPPPLQSLVHAPTVPEFPPAADALYRMALRYPWLRWLLDPEAIWMKDLFIIAAFGGKVGYAVLGEVRARQDAVMIATGSPSSSKSG
jgi:hypothetical protein